MRMVTLVKSVLHGSKPKVLRKEALGRKWLRSFRRSVELVFQSDARMCGNPKLANTHAVPVLVGLNPREAFLERPPARRWLRSFQRSVELVLQTDVRTCGKSVLANILAAPVSNGLSPIKESHKQPPASRWLKSFRVSVDLVHLSQLHYLTALSSGES